MGIIKEDNSNWKTRYNFTKKRFWATLVMLILAIGAYIYLDYNYSANFEKTLDDSYNNNYEEN